MSSRDKTRYHTLIASDSNAVSQLIHAVLREFIEQDLSPEGFQSVLETTREKSIRELLAAEKTVGFAGSITEDGNSKMVGVCVIRDWSHVHFLFVDGHYHGQGIGCNMFELALADCCEKNPKLKVMTVNSTFFAVEAYKKLGFVPIPDGYHQHNGGTFVSMEKQLTF